ncbi:MAG: hypothetical protein II038_11065 [Lachnospiraceae bacterium]|nr:hypothetical protein [Lachnospiraceae bacterium]
MGKRERDTALYYVHMSNPNVYRVAGGGVICNTLPSFHNSLYRSFSAAKSAITRYTKTNAEAIRSMVLPVRFDVYELKGETKDTHPIAPIYTIMATPTCLK